MDEAKAQAASEEHYSVPETPEDVAILYSWANIPGAKYRDFSASRRQFRAQQRAQVAERQRQAELQAAKDLEAAAQREFDEAERLRKESRRSDMEKPADWDDQFRSRELVRRAEEQALRERQEAQRRQRSAESLGVQARRARSEMLEARKRAEEQAARYSGAAASYHEQFNAEAQFSVPGETSDPYYYTGQVDPAYFAATPGVRTAQAARVSSERRTYSYPIHSSSEEPEVGSLQGYRSNTTFAPSPSQSLRPPRANPPETGLSPVEPAHVRIKSAETSREPDYPADDPYYDGKPPAPKPDAAGANGDENGTSLQDVVIRPVARTPDSGAGEMPAINPDERKTESVASENLPEASPVVPHPIQSASFAVTRGNEPITIEEQEAFVGESEMFFDEKSVKAAFAEASREREAARVPFLAAPVAPDLVPEPPFSLSLEESVERSVFPGAPEDTRVRLSRQESHAAGKPEQQRHNGSSHRTPSWLEPASEQSQRFLPPRLRQEMEKSSSLPLKRNSVSTRRPLNREPLPDIRRTGRPLRFNRNIVPDKNYAAILSNYDQRRAAQNKEPEIQAQVNGVSKQTPDTLQQSRERVASQWFALKGLMDRGPDLASGRSASELRTPSLCVMSLSGGVGKTSIVAGLGRALASMGEKVLLADANPHGLLPYYFGARDLRTGSVRTFTPGDDKSASVLLVRSELEGLGRDEAGQRRAIAELGRRVRGSHRVLLDLGASDVWLARRLAATHPWVLVPVAPDTNSVVTTQAVERLFAGLVDGNGQPVMPYYVLNQYDPSLPLHLDVREVLRRSLGERLLNVTLRRSPAVAEALAQGMTVVDYAPSAQITEDYMHLANWLRHISAPGSGASRDQHWGGQ